MSRFRIAVALSFALVILAALFGRPHHPHFVWDYVPAFYALLGYAGCWLLVVGAKTLAQHWVERKEGYYDE